MQLIASLGTRRRIIPCDAPEIESGRISPKSMITGTCDLAGINQVFQEMNTFQNVGVTVCNKYN